jgi:hypothetical protein
MKNKKRLLSILILLLSVVSMIIASAPTSIESTLNQWHYRQVANETCINYADVQISLKEYAALIYIEANGYTKNESEKYFEDSANVEDFYAGISSYYREILLLYKFALNDPELVKKYDISDEAAQELLDDIPKEICTRFAITREDVKKVLNIDLVATEAKQKVAKLITQGEDKKDYRQKGAYIFAFPKGDYVSSEDATNSDEEFVKYDDEKIAKQEERAKELHKKLVEGKDPDKLVEKYGEESQYITFADWTDFGSEMNDTFKDLKKNEISDVKDLGDAFFVVKLVTNNDKEKSESAYSEAMDTKYNEKLDSLEEKYCNEGWDSSILRSGYCSLVNPSEDLSQKIIGKDKRDSFYR